jgi:hypothetical protein
MFLGSTTHLVPYLCFASAFLVELDDLHHGLRMLLLLRLGDAVLLQELLPFFGKTRELAGGRVDADVSEVDGVVWSGDLDLFRSVEEVSHEG